MSDNNNLKKAKKDKNDEFYTLYSDVESEMQYYRIFLKNKVVYCCADNPTDSNFWKYFRVNFKELKLKRLISTHINGNKTEYDGEKIQTEELKSNGDFRSDECLDILKAADLIVTNPPFSLFRDLINIVIVEKKDFLILGSINNITYRDVFPHFQEKRFRLGINSGSFRFFVPNPDEVDRNNLVCENDRWYAKFGNICWYTNMDHKMRHQPLTLTETFDPRTYPMYDNYEAIDVDKIKKIPQNYLYPMGVPVTILQKFNYDQFKILGNLGSYGVDGYSLASAIYINGKKVFKRILIQRTKEEDFLYCPSKYDVSQKSLEFFANIFNDLNCQIKCIPNQNETFDNDGYFADKLGHSIGFDWEIRDKYFSHGIFLFDTLGQYERKIQKSSIQLAIQCDQEQENIIVAWHEDFLKENPKNVSCSTDVGKQECTVRYTDRFRIYSYARLDLFASMLVQACQVGYNCKAFD